MSFVVDASVAAKWLVPESDSDKAEALLVRWQQKAVHLLAPAMIRIELANVLWKQALRGKISAVEAMTLYEDFEQLGIPLESTEPLVAPALELALRHGNSAYDGVYVALALDRGCDFLTSDERLHRRMSPIYPQVRLLRDWS